MERTLRQLGWKSAEYCQMILTKSSSQTGVYMKYVFKIDKDRKMVFDAFKEDWIKTTKLILSSFGLKVTDIIIKESPSKRGYHIWVHAEGEVQLEPKDIAKIQYLLGDDETRSYLALLRIDRGVVHWNKMFDKVIWKREDDYQLNRCKDILSKDNITEEERKYVIDYLETLFKSLEELKNKIKELSEL